MLKKNKKIAFFTNIAPHYRERLWLTFAKKLDAEIHFYFGENKNQSIAPIDFQKEEWDNYRHLIHKTENYKLNKRLIYQTHVLRHVLFKKWDAILLLGDANIVSNWVIAIIANLKGIPVIFWGHGLYGNEKGFKKWIRKSFLRLADYNLVYGNWAKNLLLKEGFKEDALKVIYNSVNYEISKPLRVDAIEENFYRAYFHNDLPTLIFIGRLTKSKKLDLLINALHILNTQQKRFNLIILGDGEEKEKLESLAKTLGENVFFYGECYDEVVISKFLANADLCVSPGNVGLTSIHSMSYGTPVCTTDDFKNQGPEFEAIKAEKTGCFFDHKKQNIAETISKWFEKAKNREEIRQNCYKVVDTYYNPDVQLNVLKSVLDEVLVPK